MQLLWVFDDGSMIKCLEKGKKTLFCLRDENILLCKWVCVLQKIIVSAPILQRSCFFDVSPIDEVLKYFLI